MLEMNGAGAPKSLEAEMVERELCGLRCLIRRAPEPGRSPSILFLHGAGTRGRMDILSHHALLKGASPLLRDFGLVMPLLCGNTWLDVFEHLMRLAACAAEAVDGDPDRLVLMGNSMGGFGTWQLGVTCPECFAALVPMCGGGQDWNADRLSQTPVWAFHGALDDTVDPFYSRKMVESVNASGGQAKLTIYPDLAHNCWSRTFASDELFRWLEGQRRSAAKAQEARTHAGSAFG